MKTFRNSAVLALATGMMFSSCKKESGVTSASTLGLKIQATNKTFSLLKAANVAAQGFVWDTSYINVSKIEFEAEQSGGEGSHDSSEVHFEWTGPKVVDLFNLNSLVGEIDLQPGIYEEISLKVVALKADVGNSPVFYLSGTYTNSFGTATPIAIIVNNDIQFKVKKEGSMIDATIDYTGLVNMNLTLLLDGITNSDLESATLSNGKIIISNNFNTDLYDKINTNFLSCVESEFERGRNSGSDSGSGTDNGTGNGNDDGGNDYGY